MRTAPGMGGGETSLARRGGEGRWDAALKRGEEEDGMDLWCNWGRVRSSVVPGAVCCRASIG